MKKPLLNKRVILSGNKGNLGPIWQKFLESGGARVFGYDWDKSKPIGIDNIDVRDLNKLNYFRKWYYNELDGELMSPKQDRSNNLPSCNPPDIIINNAAIDNPPFKNQDVKFFNDYVNIVDTNLIGAINLTSLFIDDMKRAGGGLIINIGSILGNVAADIRSYDDGFEKPVGYNVSKAALIQFTRSLAAQYGQYGIRSVCLAFSAVDSGKFENPFKSKFLKCLPLGRLISRESLEAALRFAVECPELTGQQVLIDSGYTAW